MIQSNHVTIGIDEVGRGSLCSTVTCCAYVHRLEDGYEHVQGVTDSKKLSAHQRTILSHEIIKNGYYSIKNLDEKIVDRINILNATMICMRLCCISIINKITHNNNIKLYVDGNHNPFDKKFDQYDTFTDINRLKQIREIVECITVIKGDSKIYEIGCASILAKVYRDKLMEILHTSFPEYGWNKNMGYGTRDHINAIKTFGASNFHRFTFVKKFL